MMFYEASPNFAGDAIKEPIYAPGAHAAEGRGANEGWPPYMSGRGTGKQISLRNSEKVEEMRDGFVRRARSVIDEVG